LHLAGADLNAMTDYEYTPLINASHKNHDVTTRYLLDHGAEMNKPGQNGKTPVMYTIEYNAHDTLRLLLEHGADCTIRAGMTTIAHVAARYADLETLHLLVEGVKGTFDVGDLEAEDEEGGLLEEIMRERLRGGCDPAIGEAFRALMERMVPADPDLETDEEGTWEDAVERMEAGDGAEEDGSGIEGVGEGSEDWWDVVERAEIVSG
jgi:hypothetical protein